MFRISTGSSVIPTGCSAIGFLGDGCVEEAVWMDREVGGELVMAYAHRDEMERGCVKLVGR